MARHGFVLTSRDVDILASLAQVRYLTTQHIQWLHWGERWRMAERAARAAGRVNQQPKRAYERVAAMAERGLIRSIQRSADRAATVYQRLPNALRLTSAGADLLARERGLPRTAVWYDDRPIRAATTVEHRLAIGAFYAALRAELTYRERRLEAWAADHILCTDYDSVAVASVNHPLPIIPDGTFTLDGTRYVVEIDRGTTRIEQWRKKALAYQRYQRDPRFAARYGVTRCVILVVAPPGARTLAIARSIAAVYGGATQDYRFLADEHVHPFTIRRRWQQMAQVNFTTIRRGASRISQAQITWQDTALWLPNVEEQRS